MPSSAGVLTTRPADGIVVLSDNSRKQLNTTSHFAEVKNEAKMVSDIDFMP